MNKLFYWIVSLAVVMGLGSASEWACAQSPSTLIKVLDASGVEGVAGVVLLVNPGDARTSEAFVTNARGEATANRLRCAICTISAFDPRGLFASRTAEFSSSSSSFSLVLQLRPLIDTVGDPKAVSMELVIHDPKGKPLAQQDVVIRPAVMTLEGNKVSLQRTDTTGRLTVHLRAGQYAVAAVTRDTASEARFEIVSSKGQCSEGAGTCVVALPQSSSRLKPLDLQLVSAALR
ncbi:MAG TPA: hypothetical protein VG672_02170 [Bryobacteraceae bacterium]|jgi:hypothetical protein|nr:hypothetical protein [Bryobacteraceae bacterium]